MNCRGNENLPKYFSGEYELNAPQASTSQAVRQIPEIIIEECGELSAPSPTSSVTSGRKLEWDSGADIGYSNYMANKLLQKSTSMPSLQPNSESDEVQMELAKINTHEELLEFLRLKVGHPNAESTPFNQENIKRSDSDPEVYIAQTPTKPRTKPKHKLQTSVFNYQLLPTEDVANECPNITVDTSRSTKSNETDPGSFLQRVKYFKQLRLKKAESLQVTTPINVECLDKRADCNVGTQTSSVQNHSNASIGIQTSRRSSKQEIIYLFHDKNNFKSSNSNSMDTQTSHTSNRLNTQSSSDQVNTQSTGSDQFSNCNSFEYLDTKSANNEDLNKNIKVDVAKSLSVMQKLIRSKKYDPQTKEVFMRKLARKLINESGDSSGQNSGQNTLQSRSSTNTSKSSKSWKDKENFTQSEKIYISSSLESGDSKDAVVSFAKRERENQLNWINNEIEHLAKLKNLLETKKKAPLVQKNISVPKYKKSTAVYVITTERKEGPSSQEENKPKIIKTTKKTTKKGVSEIDFLVHDNLGVADYKFKEIITRITPDDQSSSSKSPRNNNDPVFLSEYGCTKRNCSPCCPCCRKDACGNPCIPKCGPCVPACHPLCPPPVECADLIMPPRCPRDIAPVPLNPFVIKGPLPKVPRSRSPSTDGTLSGASNTYSNRPKTPELQKKPKTRHRSSKQNKAEEQPLNVTKVLGELRPRSPTSADTDNSFYECSSKYQNVVKALPKTDAEKSSLKNAKLPAKPDQASLQRSPRRSSTFSQQDGSGANKKSSSPVGNKRLSPKRAKTCGLKDKSQKCADDSCKDKEPLDICAPDCPSRVLERREKRKASGSELPQISEQNSQQSQASKVADSCCKPVEAASVETNTIAPYESDDDTEKSSEIHSLPFEKPPPVVEEPIAEEKEAKDQLKTRRPSRRQKCCPCTCQFRIARSSASDASDTGSELHSNIKHEILCNCSCFCNQYNYVKRRSFCNCAPPPSLKGTSELSVKQSQTVDSGLKPSVSEKSTRTDVKSYDGKEIQVDDNNAQKKVDTKQASVGEPKELLDTKVGESVADLTTTGKRFSKQALSLMPATVATYTPFVNTNNTTNTGGTDFDTYQTPSGPFRMVKDLSKINLNSAVVISSMVTTSIAHPEGNVRRMVLEMPLNECDEIVGQQGGSNKVPVNGTNYNITDNNAKVPQGSPKITNVGSNTSVTTAFDMTSSNEAPRLDERIQPTVSASSSSTSTSTIMCSCCGKWLAADESSLVFANPIPNAPTNIAPNAPFCWPCYQQSAAREWDPDEEPFYKQPDHSCMCYTMVNEDAMAKIRDTLRELHEMECEPQCRTKKKDNDKLVCQQCYKKIKKKDQQCGGGNNKKAVAYMLKFDQAQCPSPEDNDVARNRSLQEMRVPVPQRTSDGNKRSRKKKRGSEEQGGAEGKNKKHENNRRKESKEDKNLQDYLASNRPDFVRAAEERRRCLIELSYMREQRCQKYKQLLALTNGQSLQNQGYDDKKKFRLFSTKEMKSLTAKNYKKLPEVQQKLVENRDRQIKRANKILADIFNKKLRESVLRGQVSLSTSISVINLL